MLSYCQSTLYQSPIPIQCDKNSDKSVKIEKKGTKLSLQEQFSFRLLLMNRDAFNFLKVYY